MQPLWCVHGSHTAHRTGTTSYSKADTGTTHDAHAREWVLWMRLEEANWETQRESSVCVQSNTRVVTMGDAIKKLKCMQSVKLRSLIN